MNYGHLFGPFVLDKIHVLLFIAHFHVPIFISFNPRTTHQPYHPKQYKFGPIAHLAIFF